MTDRDLEGWTLAFDLDGTLVETHVDLVGTLNRMLVQKGLPEVPMEGASALIGGGARALLQHGFERAGAPVEEARDPALFDAFIASLSARAFQLKRCDVIPEAHRAVAEREGWIMVPGATSLAKLG